MATIRLQQVTKRFNHSAPATRFGEAEPPTSVLALERVSLTIPNGQTMAVVGPSGSGKSTLLRVVAGLESDYTGQVFYDDQEMRDIPPKDRYIGMVFQNYALYPHFAGHGNLSFFFRLRKISDQETEERIRITSEIMGIGFHQLLQRKPGALSGGQQQRVAIGRAIVRNPRLFLLDEPLSNLDAKLRAQTRVEIKRLLQRFQITGIYVTHDQAEAIALGDLVAVMRAGRVEQIGPFQSLMQRPANLFVAGFLGLPPMNLLGGGVVEEGQVRLGDQTLPLPPDIQAQSYRGQTLTLGVRPEATRLVESGATLPAGLRVAGVAEVIEPDFGRRLQWVHVRHGVQSLVALGALDQVIYAGHPVELFLPADQLQVFDSASEQRLGLCTVQPDRTVHPTW
jgi:ABC-type sugar transport system ATPase subunit